jgi:hypothetical protein
LNQHPSTAFSNTVGVQSYVHRNFYKEKQINEQLVSKLKSKTSNIVLCGVLKLLYDTHEGLNRIRAMVSLLIGPARSGLHRLTYHLW